jgi:hypothetical protein
MKTKIIIGIVLTLALLQFIRIDKTNPASKPESDFLTISGENSTAESMIKAACYDCHSNTTVYPWYTNIAPVSWMIKHHVNEGRDELNFSHWDSYSMEEKIDLLQESSEEVLDGEMPALSYRIMHSSARMSEEEKSRLAEWFKAKAYYLTNPE